jgi:hypothetical protein
MERNVTKTGTRRRVGAHQACDPLADIRELENIDIVIKGGLIFKAQ